MGEPLRNETERNGTKRNDSERFGTIGNNWERFGTIRNNWEKLQNPQVFGGQAVTVFEVIFSPISKNPPLPILPNLCGLPICEFERCGIGLVLRSGKPRGWLLRNVFLVCFSSYRPRDCNPWAWGSSWLTRAT